MDLEVLGVIVATSSVRLTVHPSRIRDVEKLMGLQARGFLPDDSIRFDHDEQAFVVELDGDAVTHLLELVDIATEERTAETWGERLARSADQLDLHLSPRPRTFDEAPAT